MKPADQVVEVKLQGPGGEPLTLKITRHSKDFAAVMGGVRWPLGPGLSEKDLVMAALAIGHGLLGRIQDWEGVVAPDGSPIPCTMEAKMAVLEKYPQILMNLAVKLAELDAAPLEVENDG